jgi:hypothetical protein
VIMEMNSLEGKIRDSLLAIENILWPRRM